MNKIADEIIGNFGCCTADKPQPEDILEHYGTKMRSGRYPWGSGHDAYQNSGDFIARVEELKKRGLNEVEQAKELKLSTTDLRMQIRVAQHERRDLEAKRAVSLRQDGKSLNEIAAIMGYKNDSSVRALLSEDTATRKNMAKQTAEAIKKELDTKKMIDVGAGAERQIGVSTNTLKEAVFILTTQGYNHYGVGVPIVNNPGKQITRAVICTPDIEYGYAWNHGEEVHQLGNFNSKDGGLHFDKLEYPSSLSSDRVHIKYGDQGGTDKDGVIEIRRGVKDLSLGNSTYAQVRILVDGTHYMKGMAMYSDDIPKGADIVFNTNKPSGTPKMGSENNTVLKNIKDDPDNPFGASIKANGQNTYDGEDGKKHLSPINKLKEEGDWEKMSKNLSSQFLSKQPMQLINQQLKTTLLDYKSQYEDIMKLDNVTVKKKMLLDFATQADGAVVHLKAAALPRQKTQVLLPIPTIKETEVYAPNFKNGEKIVLIRYPHGGTFEIPELTVNNKHADAKRILGMATDAVGIHPKVAEVLSGADFDGDHVVAIPTNDKVRIKHTPPLDGLVGFNAKEEYAYRPGMKVMTKSNVGREMGSISNLITDMNLKGAPESKITKAVKHSMVVIDAEKHQLDYKRSEKDNDILSLKKEYQGYTDEDGNYKGGASTLISRRKQEVQVPERKGSGVIDPLTGKVTYKETGRTYEELEKHIDPITGKKTYTKTGKIVEATTTIPIMSKYDDAYELSSGRPQENAYANYANQMKALANNARKEYKSAGNLKQDPQAKIKYKEEVKVLESKLNLALLNAPREREAQAKANAILKAQKLSNPNMDKKEIKKLGEQALYKARFDAGASGKKTKVIIEDKEWEAIQAGAISDAKLAQILRYADPDDIKRRATPKVLTTVSAAQSAKIKHMANTGYTTAEIANAVGLSTSAIIKQLKGDE